MPDRIIRDEILRSERYWNVSIEARLLFIHLLLVADDTARFSGKNFTIRSACFPGQAVDPGKLERLLSELQDVDLIRLYNVGDERFIFVPRFKQRLRFTKSKYPVPPQEINDIVIEKTDSSQTQVRLKTAEVKRSEEKRSKPMAESSLPAGFFEFWKTYPRRTKKPSAEKAWKKLNPDQALQDRILQAIERQKTSPDWTCDNGQFIPYPASWLNERRWEDEPTAVTMKPRPPVF